MILFQRIRATLENHAGDCKPMLVTENENKLETVMKEMLDNNWDYFILPTLPNFVHKSD